MIAADATSSRVGGVRHNTGRSKKLPGADVLINWEEDRLDWMIDWNWIDSMVATLNEEVKTGPISGVNIPRPIGCSMGWNQESGFARG